MGRHAFVQKLVGDLCFLNSSPFAKLLDSCVRSKSGIDARRVHARIIKTQFSSEIFIQNRLVDAYGKCGYFEDARKVFDHMPQRNTFSYNAILSVLTKFGYTQNGENEEAVRLFLLLKRESVWPTHYTFGNLLNACANLADLKLGRQAHTHILKHGFWFQSEEESDIFVGNSLIDMYMKCGLVEEGCLVFEHMVERDIVSWNAMIVGYAQNGNGTNALEIFRKMLVSGEKPDHVTMIGVLSACSHAGLVEEGRRYFQSMWTEHGLAPMKDHFTCMVDLLGRAGCLDEANNLIQTMPMQPDAIVWGSLLAACKVHGNIKLGQYVAEKLMEIDPLNSGPYVLLSNMYAEHGRWKDVMTVRKQMRQRGIIKQPGCSWIEIQSRVHVFMVKDKRHPRRKDIHLVLKILTEQMKRAGYVPEADDDEICEEESDSELILHCEMETEADTAVA
ncbi:Pentatricopeptide repeat-containing protein [Spatholobus suberectus]|nr:Pentatricopeptide repeat-containing protein [Spatholobus suberectus]